MLLRADKDNNDVIESFSLYYIFSVFPNFVYYYIFLKTISNNIDYCHLHPNIVSY